MNELILQDHFRDRVVFVGQTLGPLFLEDPQKGDSGRILFEISKLDLEGASGEWPFVEESKARPLLQEMQQGLAGGIDAEDLVWEYRRLFVGPGRKPVPPWGSVYTDREGVVFGQSTLELRRWLREKGIERFGSKNTPEDHIGLLLLLMAWIIDNKPACFEEYLSTHLLTWSSHFLKQLAEAARQPFYGGLARLTQASLEGIQDELKIVIEYPRYYR